MNKLISGTKNLILSKQQTIISSTMIVAVTIILSKFAGFLRFRILAGYFGKDQLDIFFASFRIPDLVFEILITGALTATFIPIFIKYQKNKEELSVNISSIINIISAVLIVLVLLMFLLADWFIPLITPGFSGLKIQQIVLYSKILLIGQLPFLVFGNILTGIGQANKSFVLSSIAPILYNLVIIVATIMFSSTFGLMAPILGVVIGAFVMFVVQLPFLFSSHFNYQIVFKITKGLREFFGLIVPRLITVVTAQIDATIDLTLTTLLGSGAYTVFYLAQRLQLLPVSVIGIAFGQASLPYLTEVYQEQKHEEFKKIITESILSIFFLTMPIAGFLIIARTPLVRLFFGGEKFDWSATVQTAITLSYFAIAIPAHSVYYFITRCFYAFLDSKTPFIISVISIVTNTAFSLIFIFVYKLPVWSLAISFSISIIINVIILMEILSRRIHGLENMVLFFESIKIVTTTFIASFLTYLEMKILDGLVLDTSRTLNVFLLLLIGGITFLVLYFFVAWAIGIKEASMINQIAHKARMYKKRVIEIYTEIE